jgi:SAM-dependent methyltransferase
MPNSNADAAAGVAALRVGDVTLPPAASAPSLDGASKRASALLAVCTAASLVGAGLLFWVQPLVAKLLLPLLGGSPAVWNTCMVFFQLALLGGYLYAYAGARWLGARAQAMLQAALLAVAALALPVALTPGLHPPTENWRLVPWLFAALAAMIGLPFVVVAGTAPMVQRWFAASGHLRAADPYFLYAASNVGSFAALLGFPLLLEPTLTLGQQGWAWSMGYGLLAALVLACAAMVPARGAAGNPATVAAPAVTARERLWWIVLAFVPSSLLLGLTTHVTTDLAAVPLFWVVPLALYLLTFVVAFATRGRRLVAWATAAQPWPLMIVALAPLTYYLDDWRILLPLHLLAFTFAALMCHGRLAAMRPPAARLTEFYLWIAVGGALGGMFNALAAPLLFPNVEEYPLMLAAACLLRPGIWPSPRKKLAMAADFILPVVVVAAFYWPEKLFALAGMDWDKLSEAWAFALIAALALPLWLGQNRPVRLALAAGFLLFAGMVDYSRDIVFRERTFFGTLKVVEDNDDGLRYLKHGTTLHGAQFMAPDKRMLLVGYYHPQGPVGEILTAIGGTPRTQDVAIVGLGTGTLACYGRAGEHWRYFEIDPAVEGIARNTRFFTYLSSCPASVDVVLGDARLSLAREPDGRFGVIVLDAFTSDAIPIHLLTREALAMYLEKLAPDGLLLIHISNRYFDLSGPLARAAASLGVVAVHRDDDDEIENGDDWKSASHWVVFARTPEAVAFLDGKPGWEPLPPEAGRPWSDDFSNVIEALAP